MTLSELVAGLRIIESTADMSASVSGVSYDSRRTQKGDLFVAVRGFVTDGHEYIAAAAQKGAACVVCEQKPTAAVPYILIENTRRGLAVISSNFFHNPTSGLKMIGVTGTNGKTTTTALIKSILEKNDGAMVGLVGTNSNMIGKRTIHTERTTPESYELHKLFREMADTGCRYVVMEVSSHALFLDRVYGIRFEVGVFMNLTPEHLDFHKSMDEYAEAKALLFSASKHSVINIDDPYSGVMRLAAGGDVTTFSINDDEADIIAKRIKLREDRTEFCALTIGKLQKVELAIPGMFSVYNALGALGAVMALGVNIKAATDALAKSGGVKGRAEVVPTNRDFTVIIDYAHTPDALQNIISTLRAFTKNRVITLFGSGGDRDRKKRPVMGEIAVRLSDFVIVTSDNPRTEKPGDIIAEILTGMEGTATPYIVIENRREAIKWGINNARPGDVLLLAGKGHETYQTVGKENFHFDEREIVREYTGEG